MRPDFRQPADSRRWKEMGFRQITHLSDALSLKPSNSPILEYLKRRYERCERYEHPIRINGLRRLKSPSTAHLGTPRRITRRQRRHFFLLRTIKTAHLAHVREPRIGQGNGEVRRQNEGARTLRHAPLSVILAQPFLLLHADVCGLPRTLTAPELIVPPATIHEHQPIHQPLDRRAEPRRHRPV